MFLSKERERKARDRIKNQTYRHESSDLFSLQGGEALHIFTQTFTLHLKWKREKRAKNKSAVGVDGGGL